MTPKQEEKLRSKIKRIKSALAADKREWGGFYHDGRGLRYTIPELYIKLGDYSGGLRYLNWFHKNFPDDMGFPGFLFEWTLILFKKGKTKEAEKKAFQTFCLNTYLFDKFFGRKPVLIDKWEGSNLERSDYAEQYFHYSHEQDELADFTAWLGNFLSGEKFSSQSKKYIEVQKRLKTEEDRETRSCLVKLADQLENEF